MNRFLLGAALCLIALGARAQIATQAITKAAYQGTVAGGAGSSVPLRWEAARRAWPR